MSLFNNFVNTILETEVKDFRKETLQFFYALKVLLEKGDNFELLKSDNQNMDNAAHCKFIYNGTRYIKVFWSTWYYKTPNISNVSISIFETDANYSGKSSRKLDTNAYYNHDDSRPQMGHIGFDPKVTTVRQFVDYVESVLERQDRDRDWEAPEVPSSPVKTSPQKPVMV